MEAATPLPAIIASLRSLDFVDEILVWNNNPEVRLEVDDGITRIIDSEMNVMCCGRYLCVAEARNRIVYVQDDDALNHDIAGLYRHFLADPGRVAHALTVGHYQRRHRQIYDLAHNALLGWGAFFDRDWIEVFNSVPPEMFEQPLMLREADKFFTMLLGRRHTTIVADVTLLDGHSAPGTALWRDHEHRLFRGQAVCQALRWLRLRGNRPTRLPWNVVVTCHNYGHYLADAVLSVVASDADYVHIVDDCSNDCTADVATELAHRFSHVHFHRNRERRGAGYSRNRGIAAVASEYVVLLDADDMIGPDYLFEAGRMLATGADVVNPDAVLFGDVKARWVVPDITTLTMQLHRNHVHCCSAFRRGLWEQVGGLDESLPCWMDYDFWIRVAATGAWIRGLHGDHFFYRQHGTSLSSEAKALRHELRAYLGRKHAGLLSLTWPTRWRRWAGRVISAERDRPKELASRPSQAGKGRGS